MGNHEHMMLDALDAPNRCASTTGCEWRAGLAAQLGRAERRAAGTALRDMIPAEHLRFLRGLALHHREGGYLFVHAGIRPGLPIERQMPLDLMWIREPFLSWTGDLGAVVVHGHTPRRSPS